MTGRRWLWALGGLVAVLVIVVVVVLVAGDDSETSSPRTTTTTTEAPTTTTTAPTTTAPPTTAPPTTTTIPLPPLTDAPSSYAEFLFVAWQNGDRTAAAEVASAEAVDELFAEPYSPASQWTLDTCLPAAGSLYCTWNGAGGRQLQMTVRTLTGGLPIQVMQVEFTTS